MLLEEKINNLNHNTKSAVNTACFQKEDSAFQNYYNSIYSRFLNIDDQNKVGYRTINPYTKTINEGQVTEAELTANQSTVWTDHGPLVRTNELVENTFQTGPYDRYFVVSFEGFFLMPPSPKNDLPPRYEYVNLSRISYFKEYKEVASYVQGAIKVDDHFIPVAEGVAQRDVSSEGVFGLLERQFSTAIDFAEGLPIDMTELQNAQ